MLTTGLYIVAAVAIIVAVLVHRSFRARRNIQDYDTARGRLIGSQLNEIKEWERHHIDN